MATQAAQSETSSRAAHAERGRRIRYSIPTGDAPSLLAAARFAVEVRRLDGSIYLSSAR